MSKLLHAFVIVPCTSHSNIVHVLIKFLLQCFLQMQSRLHDISTLVVFNWMHFKFIILSKQNCAFWILCISRFPCFILSKSWCGRIPVSFQKEEGGWDVAGSSSFFSASWPPLKHFRWRHPFNSLWKKNLCVNVNFHDYPLATSNAL